MFMTSLGSCLGQKDCKKMSKNIEYVLEMIVGDYLPFLEDGDISDEEFNTFCDGLEEIGEKLGINIRKYDTNGVFENLK